MSEEGNMGTPPPGTPGRERRAAPRHPSSLKVICYPAGAGLTERRQVRLRNVSRNGLALTVDRRWEPGTALVLELPVSEGEGVSVARARVIHATPQAGGTFLVGCVLDFPLTDAQLQSLTS
jgi:hypothetical protein